MSLEKDQRVKVGLISFYEIAEANPRPIVAIRVSRERLRKIRNSMGSGFVSSGGIEKYKRLLLSGYNLSNALMPQLIDSSLREILTSSQYQRALKANREGKTLKFQRPAR